MLRNTDVHISVKYCGIGEDFNQCHYLKHKHQDEDGDRGLPCVKGAVTEGD